jgi:hypothetical protein
MKTRLSRTALEAALMPRCYSCGKFTKRPHREFDGRVERAFCDFCHAEREWKLDDKLDTSDGLVNVEPPPLSIWEKVKQFFNF